MKKSRVMLPMKKSRVTLKSLAELCADTQRMLLAVKGQLDYLVERQRYESRAEHLPDVEASEIVMADEENPVYWRGYAARVKEEDARTVRVAAI